jgi:hypothetical protein
VEGLGCFAESQAGEEAEFDELGRAGVFAGQLAQGFIDSEEVVVRRVNRNFELVKVESLTAAAFFSRAVAGAVDEDAAHGFGRGGKEVAAVLPLKRLVADQTEVSFVDEGGSLNRLARFFLGEPACGELAKLVVHDRE